MNQKIELAMRTLDSCWSASSHAHIGVEYVLSIILSSFGEEGLELKMPSDAAYGIAELNLAHADVIDRFIPIAQISPLQFTPITRIRFRDRWLEVFVQEYEVRGDVWVLKTKGEWVDYEDAHILDPDSLLLAVKNSIKL